MCFPLSLRFDIKGFPTIKLLSKGKVYSYKGKRTADAIAEFAKGGYASHEAEEVKAPLGMFGEIKYVYMEAYKQSKKDLQNKNFFTINVFLAFMPALFVLFTVATLCLPTGASASPKEKRGKKSAESSTEGSTVADPTSEKDDSHEKNE